MKVLQLDPFGLTPYYNMALCEALAQLGCAVRYVTSEFLYDKGMHISESFCTDKLYFSALKHPEFLKRPLLRRALRLGTYWHGHALLLHSIEMNPPDVIHMQWSRFPLLDLALVRRIQELGIPIVHTIHDIEPLFSYAQAGLLAEIYGRANRLIVHSESNKQTLLRRYPQINAELIRIVSHLLPAIPSGEITRLDARHILTIPENAPVILFFGSIRPYKSLHTLIKAHLLARREIPGLWIIIAGRLADKRAARALRRLQEQAIVHLDYIPVDQVPLYHRAADVAVFPYERISQSGALITAMGFELPVIVTDVGAMPETVDGNGWVVPSGNVAALTRALLDATSTPQRLKLMGRRSGELIAERHHPATVARQTLTIYNELIRQ